MYYFYLFYLLENPKLNYIGEKLREHINGSALSDILLQLKNSPAGLDSVLKLTVPFGVAFHHAGIITYFKFIVCCFFSFNW